MFQSISIDKVFNFKRPLSSSKTTFLDLFGKIVLSQKIQSRPQSFKLNSLTAAVFIGEGEKADAATTVDARIRAVVFMVIFFYVLEAHNGI